MAINVCGNPVKQKNAHTANHTCVVMHRSQCTSGFTWSTCNNSWKLHCTQLPNAYQPQKCRNTHRMLETQREHPSCVREGPARRWKSPSGHELHPRHLWIACQSRPATSDMQAKPIGPPHAQGFPFYAIVHGDGICCCNNTVLVQIGSGIKASPICFSHRCWDDQPDSNQQAR